MISYGQQHIDKKDIKAVIRALKSDSLTIGPLISDFESKISELIKADCFVVSSGTAALHCAYAAIDLQPGDEVITTPITFVSTASTAMHFGAKIVFCDIDPRTGNMNPDLVESLISDKTKAITVVDFAGHPADLLEFRRIADKFGLFLIEDAAHSFGSKYRNIPVGSIADLTIFSFFPTKNITTAEGGAVSSTNLGLLDKARKFGRQGLVRDKDKFINQPDGPWHQEVHHIGLNYRLPDVLCSLGISQIAKIDKFKSRRNEIFNFYQESLSNISLLKLPTVEKYAEPFWHLYPVRVKNNQRNALHRFLWSCDIRAQVNYVPVYHHPVFKNLGYKSIFCPEAEDFYQEELSLPIHLGLSSKDLDLIVKKLVLFAGNTN
jgi:dTDP-4-amino-4,6-dideoxygalactose transaminase